MGLEIDTPSPPAIKFPMGIWNCLAYWIPSTESLLWKLCSEHAAMLQCFEKSTSALSKERPEPGA